MHTSISLSLREGESTLLFLRFIFLGDMPVKADGKLHPRTLYNFLLFFVFEELRHVIVCFEGMQAVVVDVDFPKDTMLRHFTEVAVGLFSDRTDKGKHIGVRHPDRALTTLIDLCVDICQRNGIEKLNFTGDKNTVIPNAFIKPASVRIAKCV